MLRLLLIKVNFFSSDYSFYCIIFFVAFLLILNDIFFILAVSEKEGKAFNFSYQDKLKSVALTQQVSHGKYNADILPPLGVLDVIGRDRRYRYFK